MNKVYVLRDDLVDLSHLDCPMPTVDQPIPTGNLVVDLDDIMRLQPDDDVVKVIRCSACDHHLIDYSGDWWCRGCGHPPHRISPSGFCSNGVLGEGKVCS